MKIMCFIDSLGSGGAQRQIVGLSCLLYYRGFEVIVASYHNDNFYQDILNKNNIEYVKIYANNKLSKIIKTYLTIRHIKPEYIISYLDGPNIITCLLHSFFIKKIKLIVSERNTTQTLTIKEYLKFFFYNWADIIVANSISQTEYITKNFKFLSKKITTITNFVDTSFFIPTEKKQDLTTNKTLHLLVVARICEQKNVIRFIHAIKLVINKIPISVDWYGEAYSKNYYNQCLNLISSLGLKECLRFHKAEKDVVTLYQNADIFCLPSVYEGFPNVICEAMSCGLPILCGDICDNPTIVHDNINGILFNPLSVTDIANSILKYWELPPKQKNEMRKLSRKFAESYFSPDLFVEKYIKLLR